jgi:hypothetical protein
MAALDRVKEEIAYLKFWQGIAVVTDISLLGWLTSALDSGATATVGLAMAGVVLLTCAAVFVHRRIERRIAQIGAL